ncbi:MAG: cell division protein ZapA [Pseudomonadota bacterium]
MAHVSVVIDGKTYRMACDEGQDEHLRALAVKLDSAIQNLKGGFGEIGDLRLAIMAGIMIADEHSEMERQNRALEAEVASLKENRKALIERYQSTEETLSGALSEVVERIDTMAEKLKQDVALRSSGTSALG